MSKNPIGILDMCCEGIDIAFRLANHFHNETVIYLNDFIGSPYEGRTPDEIQKYVEKNIEIILGYDLKMLIVVSDTIIEYCAEMFTKRAIPVLLITDLIIEYVNKNYELKNMVLFAKDGVLKANLYQKNLNYNHLYEVNTDEMEKVINDNMTKTARSFRIANEALRSVPKKGLEVLVYTLEYLQHLRIEIDEYIQANNIIAPSQIIIEKIENDYSNLLSIKSKGKLYILSQLPKKEFLKKAYWLEKGFTYFDITNDGVKIK